MKALRWLGIGLAAAVVLAVLYGGLMFSMSESGEVIVLRTRDAAGEPHETRLWIVEDGGYQWLRAGAPESGWYVRLVASPEVSVERVGEERRYRAVPVPDPAVRERVHVLMAQKYGFPDRFIAATVRDGTVSVPIRLEPLE